MLSERLIPHDGEGILPQNSPAGSYVSPKLIANFGFSKTSWRVHIAIRILFQSVASRSRYYRSKKNERTEPKAFDGTKQWSQGLVCCSCISVDHFQSRMPASLHRNSDMDRTNMSRANEYNNIIEQRPDLVRDQLLGLLLAEKSYLVESIPCKSPSYSYNNNNNNNSERVVPLEDWRRKICQWAFRVIDHFRLDREIVSTGMNLFDRFLLRHQSNECDPAAACFCPSCKRSLDSPTYQLAAMTCVFLAVKLHSQNNSHHPAAEDSSSSSSCRGGGGRRSHKQFKLNTFVELSRGQFRAQDICDMEATVLATLRWKVSPPTPMTFVSYLVTTLMPDREMMPSTCQTYYNLVLHVLRELSRYLTELAACVGGGCSYYPASEVAFAAILVSMDLLTHQALPLHVREAFCREFAQVRGEASSSHTRGSIPHLRSVLQRALWPEMLLESTDDPMAAESGHPISMARDYGLLDLDRIHRAQQRHHAEAATAAATSRTGGHTPPGSPKRYGSFEESPISVAR